MEERAMCPIHVLTRLAMVLEDGSGHCYACRTRVQSLEAVKLKPDRLTLAQGRPIADKTATKKRATKKAK
jgi:hypothetical protein